MTILIIIIASGFKSTNNIMFMYLFFYLCVIQLLLLAYLAIDPRFALSLRIKDQSSTLYYLASYSEGTVKLLCFLIPKCLNYFDQVSITRSSGS